MRDRKSQQLEESAGAESWQRAGEEGKKLMKSGQEEEEAGEWRGRET